MSQPPAQQVDTSVARLAPLLSILTNAPSTEAIRQAEIELKPILKQSSAMMSLWQIITETSPPALRQIASILLRKRIQPHYSNWPLLEQLEWQNHVLHALAAETVRPVRLGLVAVAAALAQVHTVATPPFLQFCQAAQTSDDTQARELVCLLLQEMTETIGLHWKDHIPSLVHLFGQILNSPTDSWLTKKAAVQAVGQLLSFWADEEDELQQVAPLLPTVLQVASQLYASSSANDNHDDFLGVVLDVLYELAYSPAPCLSPHLALTCEFALAVLRNRSVEPRVRDAAALVLATTAEAKPKTVGRDANMLAQILDTLFQLMQESSESAAGALFESNPAWRKDLVDGDDDDDHVDDEDDAPTETSMAQGTLDMFACEIPKKYIWQPALSRCLDRMSNVNDASARKAGVAGLGVIAEGCCEPLTATLPTVLPLVLQAARDASPQVRECACFCLGQISEHCQPDILQYSESILPIVFGLLDDGSVAVQATSCYVLEMFCERLEPDAVRPLLDPLVRKLASMLEATAKRSVQEMAVAALAATAVAAEEEFTPYVPGVAAIMTVRMQLHDAQMFSLRGRALECMGHVAIAVGRDTFRPYFMVTMQCAMDGLSKDSTELQEFAYAVFANLAKVMKEEFAPALPDLVPHLVTVIQQDEGQLEQQQDEDNDNQLAGLDDSDDDEEGGQYVLHVRTALLEVKKGAITALGEMAAHTGTSFCPYLEECMQVLQKAATNWHPLIKTEVADAFPAMIVPSIDAYHGGELQWKKGDVSAENPLSVHTNALVGAVLREEILLLKDEDKMVVSKACEAVQSVIELCGPHALLPVANDCLGCAHDILTKSAPCQADMYGEQADEDDDHDGVMQAACDLVGAFCRVMGAHFAQYLPQFLPSICEFSKSSRPPSDRSMAVGCLSEIAQELEGAIAEYWKSVFLGITLAGLVDPEDNVKRNAAFCAGVCCEHLRELAAPDYPAILQHMGPIFTLNIVDNDAAAACVDNAAAAVARMIMACPTQVPMTQVLPVLLRALPLKTDMTENETVYACLLGLLQMNHPDMLANIPDVKRIFTDACQEESKLDDETKSKVAAALAALNNAQQ